MAIAFEDNHVQDVQILSVTGRLDAATVPLFEAHYAQLAEAGRKKMLFDFSGVEYLSSIALRSLLAIHKKLSAEGGKLVLCGVKGTVWDVFELSGFSEILHLADTMELALGKLL